MDVHVIPYQSKIKLLLDKLFETKCRIQNGGLVKKVLTYISQKGKETNFARIVFPVFTEWIKQAVTEWSTTGVTPQRNIVLLTVNLASLLSDNEDRFCALNVNFFIKLISVLKLRQPEIDIDIKLSYIKLLSSFLNHKSGSEWIMASNFWEDIFNLSLSDQNSQIFKEITDFMTNLLEKTIDLDESFCENVVKRMMVPLGENIYKALQVSPDLNVPKEIATQYLKPPLELIGNILDHFLRGVYLHNKDFAVVLIFFKAFHKEERVSDFLTIAQSKCLTLEVSKILFVWHFLELYFKVTTKTATTTNIACSLTKIKHSFLQNFSKDKYEEVVEFSTFGLLYWNLMESKIPAAESSDSESFSNQFVVIFFMPHCCLLTKHSLRINKLEEEGDECREVFITKIIKMYGECARVFLFWQKRLKDSSDLFRLGHLCFTRMKEFRIFFSRYQAVAVFQALTYSLKDIVVAFTPQTIKIFQNEPFYIVQIIELLGVVINDFEITWKDSVEAIDVIDLAFDFLSLCRWSNDVVVQILKLLNIATAKYMSPSLVLLIDSPADSAVAKLGNFLFQKLRQDHIEVKKAAMDVVCTMACLSSGKFPSLQKVLMDSELPTLVVKMSACDGESFVRATAIKCLQEMIQVEEIWNNALKTEDLSQKMRDILLNETEGIVRVEAATFMCVAYEHQQFPKDTLNKVYETMIYSSTTDLHWEVKVRALGFWDKVIKNHLQNQGMIDDSFPNVTFSKEHRKIVTLTDSEIRKRLLKVLSQLSSIGCLGVLMSAIKDDCDMEVSKTAVKITQRLVDLFKKYNVRSDCSAPTSPLPTENGMSATVSMSSGISVDESVDSPASNHPDFNEEIIDQIVNSKDVSLLKNVYAPSDYGSVSNYDIQVRKIVTPNEFLQFTQQDLNNLITEKKNWLNGIEDLGSLLDDMLKTYDDDVNNMDCY